MVVSPAAPIILHAEQEHARLRLVVALLLILSYLLILGGGYALLRRAPGDWPNFALTLACILAAPPALGITWGVETWLKKRWPSGYTVRLDAAALTLQQPDQPALTFAWDGYLSLLGWCFPLRGYKRGGRERRVPDKWRCVACQVQQDGGRLILYTYAPPERAARMQEQHANVWRFHKLNPVEVYGNTLSKTWQPPTRPDHIPAAVLSGPDGRYWLAERHRWQEGLELPPAEFETFLQYFQLKVADNL